MSRRHEPENQQTRDVFAAEASRIYDQQKHLEWMTPSRREEELLEDTTEGPEVLSGDEDVSTFLAAESKIRGSQDRGLVIHKLLEEVLSGEVAGDVESLTARAERLIREVGRESTPDPAEGLSPTEIAECVARALTVPEIAAMRPRLIPEFPVYSVALEGRDERVTAGIVDAIALGADGAIDTVIDWKSDVAPTPEIVEKYRDQVQAYLDALAISRGLVVFVTTGQVVSVTHRG